MRLNFVEYLLYSFCVLNLFIWDSANDLFNIIATSESVLCCKFHMAGYGSTKINGYFIHTHSRLKIPLVLWRILYSNCLEQTFAINHRAVRTIGTWIQLIEARSHFLYPSIAASKSRKLSRFNEGLLLRSMLDVIYNGIITI